MTYTKLPSLSEWQRDSRVAFKVRNDDVVLKRIDDLVQHVPPPTEADRFLIYLSDLFFTTDYWLKTYETNTVMEKGRTKAVQALFARSALELCHVFRCSINGLPRELELMWGREMSVIGVKKDLKDREAVYMARAEAAKFKLYFQNGRAYQYPWWGNTLEWRRVLAESKHAFDYHAFVTASRKPGAHPNQDYGFFVLTMGRDLYMSKHRAARDRRHPGVFHSAYTAGEPISCAGTMLIRAGIIERIRFDSGHYHPHTNNVRALVMALRMFGVPLDTVVFEDFEGYKLGFDAEPDAVQDPDIGTLRFVLKSSDTVLKLVTLRNKTLDANIKAQAKRPNPNRHARRPDPARHTNRPGEDEVWPPAVKRF